MLFNRYFRYGSEKNVYKKKHKNSTTDSYEFDSSKSWTFDLNDSTPTYGFDVDCKAGDKTYDVGSGANAQWMADINDDGRADYNGTAEYWVMLSQEDNSFADDMKWGTRDYNVGYDIYGQGWADMNGDGKMDFIYPLGERQLLQELQMR